jgi:hypothetical protein
MLATLAHAVIQVAANAAHLLAIVIGPAGIEPPFG